MPIIQLWLYKSTERWNKSKWYKLKLKPILCMVHTVWMNLYNTMTPTLIIAATTKCWFDRDLTHLLSRSSSSRSLRRTILCIQCKIFHICLPIFRRQLTNLVKYLLRKWQRWLWRRSWWPGGSRGSKPGKNCQKHQSAIICPHATLHTAF